MSITDESSGARFQLPLFLSRVLPRQPTRIVARPTGGAFAVKRILISRREIETDWVVNDIEIDGRSQLSQRDLPGALFSARSIGATPGALMALRGLETVECDRELALIVTYVGPNPEGVHFYGAALGSRPPQRPTVVPIAPRERLQVTVNTTIVVRLLNAPFQIDLIKIDDGATTEGRRAWIIHDLRVDGRSQFKQSGDIPGDMFSMYAIDPFGKIDPCPAGSAIEIDVCYIGTDQSGGVFVARLEGTVTRPDYTVPPPNLHVVVETSGQDPGDEVVAICDWRPPAISDVKT